MQYGLPIGGGAVMSTPSAAQRIGELAEELGYAGIVTGDHITIPKEIGSTYPGPVDIEEVRPRFDELRGLMEAAGRNYADLEITWMVDNSRTDAAAIRAYRDLGVQGLYVTAASSDPNEVTAIMRDFKKKVEDSA